MHNEVGPIIKKMRKSKNYSQSTVSNGIMHQTNYSKFELGEIEISYNKFKKLLINLELDIVEFEYLYTKKYNPDRQEIIHYFHQLRFIDEKLLSRIVEGSNKYLEDNSDLYIKDILNVSKALLAVKDDDFDLAKHYGYRVWKRLEGADNWYLSDIKLVNSILFLFPMETAEYISKFALKQGKEYERHPEYDSIFLPFKYNLVQLLLREKRIEEANSLNEEVLNTFRKKKFYTQIALCIVRKSMIEMHLNNETFSKELLVNAYLIAEVLNDVELDEKLKQEEHYINKIFLANT